MKGGSHLPAEKAAGGIGRRPKIYNWRVKWSPINRVGKSPKLLERAAESIRRIRKKERARQLSRIRERRFACSEHESAIRFRSSSLSIHPSIFGAQLLPGNSRLLFGWLSPLWTEKKIAGFFSRAEAASNLSHTFFPSLARSLDLSSLLLSLFPILTDRSEWSHRRCR